MAEKKNETAKASNSPKDEGDKLKRALATAAGLLDVPIRKAAQILAARTPSDSFFRNEGFETLMGSVKGFVEEWSGNLHPILAVGIEKGTDFLDYYSTALAYTGHPQHAAAKEALEGWRSSFFTNAQIRLRKTPASQIQQEVARIKEEFEANLAVLAYIEEKTKIPESEAPSHNWQTEWEKFENGLTTNLSRFADRLQNLPGSRTGKLNDWWKKSAKGATVMNGPASPTTPPSPASPNTAGPSGTSSTPPPIPPPATPGAGPSGGRGFWSTVGTVVSSIWNIGNFWARWLIATIIAWPILIFLLNLLPIRTPVMLAATIPMLAILVAVILWSDPLLLGVLYTIDRRFTKAKVLSKVLVVLAIDTGLALFMGYFPVGPFESLALLAVIQGLFLNKLGDGPKALNVFFWTIAIIAGVPVIYGPVIAFMDNSLVNWVQLNLRVERRTAWVFLSLIPVLALLGLTISKLSSVVGEAGTKWIRKISFVLLLFGLWQIFVQPNRLFNPETGAAEFLVDPTTKMVYTNLPANTKFDPQRGTRLKLGEPEDVKNLGVATATNQSKGLVQQAVDGLKNWNSAPVDTIPFDRDQGPQTGMVTLLYVEAGSGWTPCLSYTGRPRPLCRIISITEDVNTYVSAYVYGTYNAATEKITGGRWKNPLPDGSGRYDHELPATYFKGADKLSWLRQPHPYFILVDWRV